MTCSKCGRDVPPGEPWCEVCKGPAEFSARDVERMKVDVRARILWADPVEAIRDAWLKKGAPAGLLSSTLDEAVRERHRHFRIRGLQDLLMAAGCFLLGGGAFWFQHAVYQGELSFSGKGTAVVMIASVVLPLAGLALAFRGVRRITSGGKEEKGASDLSELD